MDHFKMHSSLYLCFLFRPVEKSLHDIRVRRVGSLLGSLTLKGPQTVRQRRAHGTMGCAKYHFSSLGSERKGSLARDQRHLPVLHGLPKSLYRFSSTQLRCSPLPSRRLPDRDDSVPLSLFPKRHMAETFEISNEVPWDFSR